MEVGEGSFTRNQLECFVCHTLQVDVGVLLSLCVICQYIQCIDPLWLQLIMLQDIQVISEIQLGRKSSLNIFASGH